MTSPARAHFMRATAAEASASADSGQPLDASAYDLMLLKLAEDRRRRSRRGPHAGGRSQRVVDRPIADEREGHVLLDRDEAPGRREDARLLVAQPGEVLVVLVPLLCLYAINYVLSTVVARALLPRGDGIALVYGTVMRNLSIALALAMNVFGGQSAGAALVIALAYILQVQSAAWYVKLTDRLFGPAPAKTAKAG